MFIDIHAHAYRLLPPPRCGRVDFSTPDQVLSFMEEWGDTCPVVIVPTMYYTAPTQVFREVGVNLVIWANHLLRSSITAMQQTAAELYQEETLVAIEDRIAPVKEIFRLQVADELRDAERRYLPAVVPADGD